MDFESILLSEISNYQGTGMNSNSGSTSYINYETGNLSSSNTSVSSYTNRIFGAPYQLLDSVDRRFSGINTNVGNEYLKNYLLNSPVLYIKAGMPQYTGDDDTTSITSQVRDLYLNETSDGSSMSTFQQLMYGASTSTVFSAGSNLQKRMYGFRETYTDYMSHVNYMCNTIASAMSLSSFGVPSGVHINSSGWTSFTNMSWENYRMVSSSIVMTPFEALASIVSVPTSNVSSAMSAAGNVFSALTDFGSDSYASSVASAFSSGSNSTSFASVFKDKISCLQLIVDPVSYNETMSNETQTSIIESSLDALQSSVGVELAFIGNSGVDTGIVSDFASFMGNSAASIGEFMGGIVEPVTGGFAHNLFSGAIQSIMGQKMIYPEIYKASDSAMHYNYTMTLTTPYGDPYNYYMNIVVPLCHLICLVAPRMVTSNTISSPFLVQSYMPGMCSCNLGIVKNLKIVKNPDNNHVSVNNFPLTVKVEFTIQELYNAMAISPLNDPASFVYNETLTDYMSTMAGLVQSIDTTQIMNSSAFSNIESYVGDFKFLDDLIATPAITAIEDFIMHY